MLFNIFLEKIMQKTFDTSPSIGERLLCRCIISSMRSLVTDCIFHFGNQLKNNYIVQKQESPLISGAVWNATTLVLERLVYNAFCHLFRKQLCMLMRRRFVWAIWMRQGRICLMACKNDKLEALNYPFQNCKFFRNWLNRCWETATRTWPKMNTLSRFVADRK